MWWNTHLEHRLNNTAVQISLFTWHPTLKDTMTHVICGQIEPLTCRLCVDQETRWISVQPIKATWIIGARQSPWTACKIHFSVMEKYSLCVRYVLDLQTIYRLDTPEQIQQPLWHYFFFFCRCTLSQLTSPFLLYSFLLFLLLSGYLSLSIFPPFFLCLSISAALVLNH